MTYNANIESVEAVNEHEGMSSDSDNDNKLSPLKSSFDENINDGSVSDLNAEAGSSSCSNLNEKNKCDCSSCLNITPVEDFLSSEEITPDIEQFYVYKAVHENGDITIHYATVESLQKWLQKAADEEKPPLCPWTNGKITTAILVNKDLPREQWPIKQINDKDYFNTCRNDQCSNSLTLWYKNSRLEKPVQLEKSIKKACNCIECAEDHPVQDGISLDEITPETKEFCIYQALTDKDKVYTNYLTVESLNNLLERARKKGKTPRCPYTRGEIVSSIVVNDQLPRELWPIKQVDGKEYLNICHDQDCPYSLERWYDDVIGKVSSEDNINLGDDVFPEDIRQEGYDFLTSFAKDLLAYYVKHQGLIKWAPPQFPVFNPDNGENRRYDIEIFNGKNSIFDDAKKMFRQYFTYLNQLRVNMAATNSKNLLDIFNKYLTQPIAITLSSGAINHNKKIAPAGLSWDSIFTVNFHGSRTREVNICSNILEKLFTLLNFRDSPHIKREIKEIDKHVGLQNLQMASARAGASYVPQSF